MTEILMCYGFYSQCCIPNI